MRRHAIYSNPSQRHASRGPEGVTPLMGRGPRFLLGSTDGLSRGWFNAALRDRQLEEPTWLNRRETTTRTPLRTLRIEVS